MRVKILIQPPPKNRKYKSFLKQVKKLGPDFFLINSYSMLLRKDLLKIPKNGGFNIHAGLLPKYRGCNPIEWAIINGEKIVGVTLHRLNTKIDAGNIIKQKKFLINKKDTWKKITKEAKKAGAILLSDLKRYILNKNYYGYPQNNRKSSYFKRRKPADAEIDWHLPCAKIYDFIRAQVPPHHPAWYFDQSGRQKFIRKVISLKSIRNLKKKNVQ